MTDDNRKSENLEDSQNESQRQSEETVELNACEKVESVVDLEESESENEKPNEETIELNISEKKQTILNLEESNEKIKEIVDEEPASKFKIFGYRPSQLKWSNIIWLTVIHILAVYAYIHAMFNPVKFLTFCFAVTVSAGAGFGMSVGGHRLWSHRTFKAKFPLRLLLMILQTMTINGSIFSYCRDHRNHHKWPATHADPKNPARGFFFAHMGWWLLKKRPEVIEYGKKFTFEDLLSDPLVVFQHKYYIPLVIIFSFMFPTLTPVLLWNENILTSFLICCCLRVVVVLHHLFTVNSVAHFWGHRPYDRFMKPTENRIINWISMGEGNHNYHHVFPWDYSNSEKTWWEIFNPATLFIDFCKLIGLASDLKKPSPEMIQKVIARKGLPEYFEADKKRNLCKKICIGFVDWVFGIIFAKWPIWPIIIFKLLTGQQLIVIDWPIW